MKTLRRDKLKRDIQKGLLEGKCTMHLTDDYRFDASNNFGKSEGWAPIVIREVGEFFPGKINLHESDFESGSGGASINEETGVVSFRVHSNLYYEFRYLEKAS